MVDFDLDLKGIGGIRERLREFEEDWEGNTVWAVGSNVEYAVFP